MGITKRSVESAYLDPEKLELLKALAAKTRIPRAVLMREAVDDLLLKHGVLNPRDAASKAVIRRRPTTTTTKRRG